MKYQVKATQTTYKFFEVEAENESVALEKAQEMAPAKHKRPVFYFTATPAIATVRFRSRTSSMPISSYNACA